jgi:glutamate/tyrosine decarboxylase-like PLP-dependent enzyme
MSDLLKKTAEYAAQYLESLDDRAVTPSAEAIAGLAKLGGNLPDEPTDPRAVLDLLNEVGAPATVASAGRRFFGFVIGGALPASLAANWLAGAWDQNAGLNIASPLSSFIEDVATEWLVDALRLPAGTTCGFVTGATMANFTGIVAARHALLKKAGWGVEADGLFGAPPITVVVGDEVHVSMLKALSLAGFGYKRVTRVPVDDQGRLRADSLPELNELTLICAQAGNVNTGAFDPIGDICDAARAAGAWVHVDGAFGLWAAASPQYAHLAEGVEKADSWATDGHKWLNVPYDSGLIFAREPDHLRAALTMGAAYLIEGDRREPHHYVPEMSRRARGLEVWAALRSLGRSGLADMIERCCRHATMFADGLSAAGCEVLNDVTLNQVLVSFGDKAQNERVIAGIQQDGTCWCGGTVWQGCSAMRISLSSWATTDEDVERSLAAMLRVADSA